MGQAIPCTFSIRYGLLVKIMISLLLLAIVITIVQDYLHASFNRYTFYFSESLLFTAFWWPFAPLLFIQYKALQNNGWNSNPRFLLLVAAAIAAHVFMYSILLWLLSVIFFSHTYAMLQTAENVLSQHITLLTIIYSAFLLLIKYTGAGLPGRSAETMITEDPTARSAAAETQTFIDGVTVINGRKKTFIATTDIRYIQSSTPYISIHVAGKQYLHTDTLKSILEQLDRTHFVRIHKASIVNVSKVSDFTSRLNGDYDLTLRDGVTLRLSRNYAAAFRKVYLAYSSGQNKNTSG